MNITLEQINVILQREDIEGFIQSGAPDDEYEVEAQMIFEALSSFSQDILYDCLLYTSDAADD